MVDPVDSVQDYVSALKHLPGECILLIAAFYVDGELQTGVLQTARNPLGIEAGTTALRDWLESEIDQCSQSG